MLKWNIRRAVTLKNEGVVPTNIQDSSEPAAEEMRKQEAMRQELQKKQDREEMERQERQRLEREKEKKEQQLEAERKRIQEYEEQKRREEAEAKANEERRIREELEKQEAIRQQQEEEQKAKRAPTMSVHLFKDLWPTLPTGGSFQCKLKSMPTVATFTEHIKKQGFHVVFAATPNAVDIEVGICNIRPTGDEAWFMARFLASNNNFSAVMKSQNPEEITQFVKKFALAKVLKIDTTKD